MSFNCDGKATKELEFLMQNKEEPFLIESLLKNKEKNLKFLREKGIHYHAYYQAFNKKKVPMKILVDDITELPAHKQWVYGRHRSRTTLEQYLMVKYDWTLDYRNLPCIVMFDPKSGHKSYFAIETLYVCNSKKDNCGYLF
jgi:hypothetical protein